MNTAQDAALLERYRKMHRELDAEYHDTAAKLEELRGQGKTKTVTFRTLFARKLALREWLDAYERYGLSVPKEE